jgi:sec-independent protein translocase protein TatA
VSSFGWQELLIIFVILLLLFGATRLPALSKSLGQSIRGFKKGMSDDDDAPDADKATVSVKDEDVRPSKS